MTGLLQQYITEHPELPRTPAGERQDRFLPELGFLVRLAIRISGGRIRTARQASVVLLAAALIMLVASATIFLMLGRVWRPAYTPVPVSHLAPGEPEINWPPVSP